MSARVWNGTLLAATAVGMATGVRIVSSPLARVAVPRPADGTSQATPQAPLPRMDSLGPAIIARDPFRITRRPSPLPYDPTRLAQPAMPPVPKPTLVLLGVVWNTGGDPTALVDGLPGADGPRPVRRGETVGGLRVMAIEPDRLVISGLDTTWLLRVREPWR